jgi:hypothetical protein
MLVGIFLVPVWVCFGEARALSSARRRLLPAVLARVCLRRGSLCGCGMVVFVFSVGMRGCAVLVCILLVRVPLVRLMSSLICGLF